MPSAFLNLAFAGLCLATAACAAPAPQGQETNMSQQLPPMPPRPSARRRTPPKVPPVRVGDVRFEQTELPFKEANGGQRLGYLGAYKGDTDKLLWRVRVYDIHYKPELEGDVQDVFFAAMSVSPDGRQIFVDNTRGRSRLNPAS